MPKSLVTDLERMREEVEKFRKEEIRAAEFRSFRVPQGVYEERTEGRFMLRVRLPAGIILPGQMRTLAEVAQRCGNGVLHVTTRQDIQVHSVGIDMICEALETLAEAGLSTRGGGGNGVRNITSCHDAGVCAEEVFDVRPCAIALTERLIENPDNFKLPRKYKIAFAGCAADCGGALVNDLGFIAKTCEGKNGFAVYAGGGMGARSAEGRLLEEFIPVEDIFRAAEAVKRIFDAHGNRRNKHRARLRFLIQQIGFDRFRELFRAEFEKLMYDPETRLSVKNIPDGNPGCLSADAAAEPGNEYDMWRRSNTSTQKQGGRYTVSIPLTLGDINARVLVRLAAIIESGGDGMLHTTQWQNLRMHSVREADLPALHASLCELGLNGGLAAVLQNMTTCTGAQTCKLGICLSRGLAEAVTAELEKMKDELACIGDLKISISGCPNACGRHPIGHIGLFGGARRVEGRLTPQYTVQLGGRLGENRTRLAETLDVLHARNIPGFIEEFLQAFRASQSFPDYDAFLDGGGREKAAEIASRHKTVPSFKEDTNFYYDYGAEEPFSLAGRGPGECGAGVFDLIEVDLQSARESLQHGDLAQAGALAARSLLVTRGEEARDNIEALEMFVKHFVDPGLIKGKATETVKLILKSYREQIDKPDIGVEAVQELIDRVQVLYDNMDQSLKFQAPAEIEADTEEDRGENSSPNSNEKSGIEADKEADFRGVACPLNYVKTKMALGPMNSGQILSVLVDEEGCQNVPDSIKKDGHEVLDINQIDRHYKIDIRKK